MLDHDTAAPGWAKASTSPLEIVPGAFLAEAPPSLLHHAPSAAAVAAILRDGFDLRRWGQTAKLHRVPHLARHDPCGVFCTEITEGHVLDSGRPWLAFRLRKGAVALRTGAEGEELDIKEMLSHAYGASGRPLTRILRRHGVDAVRSTFEWVVLDPAGLEFLGSSLDMSAPAEWPSVPGSTPPRR